MIKGNKIDLVPATLDDKRNIYEWFFHSETTKSHSGPPDYPNVPIATWEEFFDDYHYQEYYFTGSQPEHGKGFLILHRSKPVGFISYSCFHLKNGIAELDIWMNFEANWNKGFGTDTIITLGEHLNKTLGIQELIMRPSVKNVRANKSYEKTGFKKSDKCLAIHFGFIAVNAKVGNSSWPTSLLPKGDGTYFIALPAKVRSKEKLSLSSEIEISFETRMRRNN